MRFGPDASGLYNRVCVPRRPVKSPARPNAPTTPPLAASRSPIQPFLRLSPSKSGTQRNDARAFAGAPRFSPPCSANSPLEILPGSQGESPPAPRQRGLNTGDGLTLNSTMARVRYSTLLEPAAATYKEAMRLGSRARAAPGRARGRPPLR